jgi:AraC-like DNA-binding protein
VRYLADSQVTHEAISERLGFSDASSFRRAFKRWTRQSPNAFRHGAK